MFYTSDSPEDELELEPADEIETTTLQSTKTEGSQMCTNSQGAIGKCMKFADCFPYITRYESIDFDSFQLYAILKDLATPCQG